MTEYRKGMKLTQGASQALTRYLTQAGRVSLLLQFHYAHCSFLIWES